MYFLGSYEFIKGNASSLVKSIRTAICRSISVLEGIWIVMFNTCDVLKKSGTDVFSVGTEACSLLININCSLIIGKLKRLLFKNFWVFRDNNSSKLFMADHVSALCFFFKFDYGFRWCYLTSGSCQESWSCYCCLWPWWLYKVCVYLLILCFFSESIF